MACVNIETPNSLRLITPAISVTPAFFTVIPVATRQTVSPLPISSLTPSPQPSNTIALIESRTPSLTPAPTSVLVFSGTFNLHSALGILYPQHGVVINDKTIDVPISTSTAAYTATYTVVLSVSFVQNNIEKHAVLTADSSQEGLCHSCTATIAGAIFVKRGDIWMIDTRSDDVAELGTWGNAPEIQFVRIGPNQFGFLFWNTFNAQGDTLASLSLYTVLDGEFRQVLSIPEVTYEYYDTTGPTPGRIGGYKAYYSFVEGNNPGYFDLRVEQYGTKPDDNHQFVKVDRVSLYVFNGTEYVIP